MEVFQTSNLSLFLGYISLIKRNIKDWQLVNVHLLSQEVGDIKQVAEKIKEFFNNKDGKILVCNKSELLVLVKLGKQVNFHKLENDMQSHLTGYDCKINSTEVTEDGLQKVQLFIAGNPKDKTDTMSVLFLERKSRKDKIIMVADDDMFMRSLVSKAMQAYGEIIELSDGKNVVDTYLENSPDVLFLDIHLPVRSGFDLLEEIHSFDQNAYVVMLSADSNKDNVVITRKAGAKGFIAKPFTKEKLVEALFKCPTIDYHG